MRVEGDQLLGAVRRVVGGVQIDRDPSYALAQAPSVALDHVLGQSAGHAQQGSGVQRVLEARERGLAGDRCPVDRVASEHQTRHRVLGQALCVIAVGVAEGDAEDPLAHQIEHAVSGATRIASIVDGRGERGGELVAPIAAGQQHRPAL